jgi:hypothetical protein
MYLLAVLGPIGGFCLYSLILVALENYPDSMLLPLFVLVRYTGIFDLPPLSLNGDVPYLKLLAHKCLEIFVQIMFVFSFINFISGFRFCPRPGTFFMVYLAIWSGVSSWSPAERFFSMMYDKLVASNFAIMRRGTFIFGAGALLCAVKLGSELEGLSRVFSDKRYVYFVGGLFLYIFCYANITLLWFVRCKESESIKMNSVKTSVRTSSQLTPEEVQQLLALANELFGEEPLVQTSIIERKLTGEEADASLIALGKQLASRGLLSREYTSPIQATRQHMQQDPCLPEKRHFLLPMQRRWTLRQTRI